MFKLVTWVYHYCFPHQTALRWNSHSNHHPGAPKDCPDRAEAGVQLQVLIGASVILSTTARMVGALEVRDTPVHASLLALAVPAGEVTCQRSCIMVSISASTPPGDSLSLPPLLLHHWFTLVGKRALKQSVRN